MLFVALVESSSIIKKNSWCISMVKKWKWRKAEKNVQLRESKSGSLFPNLLKTSCLHCMNQKSAQMLQLLFSDELIWCISPESRLSILKKMSKLSYEPNLHLIQLNIYHYKHQTLTQINKPIRVLQSANTLHIAAGLV
jgi:hypothetical protein